MSKLLSASVGLGEAGHRHRDGVTEEVARLSPPGTRQAA